MDNKIITITEKELKDLIRKESRDLIASMIKAQEIIVDTKIRTTTTRLSWYDDRDFVNTVDCSKGVLIWNKGDNKYSYC